MEMNAKFGWKTKTKKRKAQKERDINDPLPVAFNNYKQKRSLL